MASLIRGEHDQFVEEFYWYLLHSTATHAFPEGIFFGRRFAWSDTIPHATGAANFAFLLRHALLHERATNCTCSWARPTGGWAGQGIRIENAPTYFAPMSLRIRGTATGVAIELAPPAAAPATHCPASAPIPSAAQGPQSVNVVYRPDEARRWDFPP